jgi:hypothetical protein
MDKRGMKFPTWFKECEEDLKGMAGCRNDDRYMFDNVCDMLEYELIFELGKHKPHWRNFILDRYKDKIGDLAFGMVSIWEDNYNKVGESE